MHYKNKEKLNQKEEYESGNAVKTRSISWRRKSKDHCLLSNKINTQEKLGQRWKKPKIFVLSHRKSIPSIPSKETSINMKRKKMVLDI
jgi:hypothetical protein